MPTIFCGHTIFDQDSTPGNIDTVRFIDLNPAEVKVSRDEEKLYLTIIKTGGCLTINGHFRRESNLTNEANRIEQVELADGTIWDLEDLSLLTSIPTYGNDFLFGTDGDETIDGLSGDDKIWGLSGNDTLCGGPGKDVLYGGEGNDYLLGADGDDGLRGGPGDDILDGGPGLDCLWGEGGADIFMVRWGDEGDGIWGFDCYDIILMDEDITPDNVQVLRNPLHLRLALKDAGGGIGLDSFFNGDLLGEQPRIKQVQFADGTIWNQEKLLELTRIPTPGNDWIIGTRGNDILQGGGGDDELVGSFGNDTLDGGSGRDGLQGGQGDDIYLFGRGYGQDLIREESGDGDVVRMGNNVVPENVAVTRDVSSLYLTILDTGDQLEIRDWYSNLQARIEQVIFTDGTNWDAATLENMITYFPTEGDDRLGGTPGNDLIDGLGGHDTIWGFGGDDTLLGSGGNDSLIGGNGTDKLYGGADNDRIYGGVDDDYLDGGTGNDYLDGNSGCDIYFFSRGYSQDTINETYSSTEDVDTVELAAGILPEDITITQDPYRFYLKINDTGDQLAGLEYIELVKFDNHTVYDANKLLELATTNQDTYTEPTPDPNLLYGTDGDDVIYGHEGDDVINGGAGNDTLYGNEDNDRIQGGSGDDRLEGGPGHDQLEGDEHSGAGDDVLIGGEGDDDLRGYGGDDIFDGGPGDDSLSCYRYYSTFIPCSNPGNDTYIFGRGYGVDVIGDVDSSDSVDTIYIIAGSLIADSLRASSLTSGSPSAGSLSAGSLITDSLAANEISADGTTTCSTTIGSTSTDSMTTDSVTSDDTILDVLPSDILVSRDLENLYLTIRESEDLDQIIILRWFKDRGYHIERVEFTDGTVWTEDDLIALLPTEPSESQDILSFGYEDDVVDGLGGDDYLYGGAGNDQIDGGAGRDRLYGNHGNDTIHGGDGEDYLYGGFGDDILSGGTGNDSLIGGEEYQGGQGNDTYLFGYGSGSDYITDIDSTPGNIDRVRFVENILPSDIEIIVQTRDSEAAGIALRLRNTNDVLTLSGWFSGDEYKIELFEFSNGTIWDVAVIQLIISTGDEKDNILAGTDGADTIDGLGGRDEIYGLEGDDLIQGGEGHDRLFGGAGNDLLQGGQGDDNIQGMFGDDILDGGSGQDWLYGGHPNEPSGNDLYIFGRGYGEDKVFDDAVYSGCFIAESQDTVSLKEDILPSDVLVSRDQQHLFITITDTGDRLILNNWFGEDRYKIEQVEFSEGTVWDIATLKQKAAQATEGADILVGTSVNDILSGLGGNDTLYGYTGDDLLDGGSGNDLLHGAGGSDTYLFGLGYGQDLVYDYDYTKDRVDHDLVQIADNLSPSDIAVSRDIEDLFLTITATGDQATGDQAPGDQATGDQAADDQATGDQLTLTNWFMDKAYQIEEIVFADGTIWDVEVLWQKVLPIGTEQADILYGTLYRDQVEALAGDDFVWLFAGDDTVSGGLGHDKLYGHEGDDVMAGNEGDDLIYGGLGEDNLCGNEGADKIYGEDGRDYLEGGSGKNTLDGGAGHDIIIAGDEGDTLLGGADNDLLRGGAGLDNLDGGDGNDSLDGGPGHDSLRGYLGNDTYHFGLGSGMDTIYEYDRQGTDTDVVLLSASIKPADVLVRRDLGNLFLTLKLTGEQLTINCFFGNYYEINKRIPQVQSAIDQVEFADGTIWDAQYLADRVNMATHDPDFLVGSEEADIIEAQGGSDTIYGFGGDNSLHGEEGDDLIYGGEGDDTLYGGDGKDFLYGEAGDDQLAGGPGFDQLWGGLGNDVFQFGRGSGEDWIWDYNHGWDNSLDVIYFLDNLTPNDIKVWRYNDNLCFTIRDTGDCLKIFYWFRDTNFRAAKVQFFDGTVWDEVKLDELSRTIIGTEAADKLRGYAGDDFLFGLEGDDELIGFNGHDLLDGGSGHDTLYGDYGNDIYIFGRGSGQDTLDERAYIGWPRTESEIDTLRMTADVLPSDILITRDYVNLYLTILDTGDQLKIVNWFTDQEYLIHRVEFSDVTIWDDAFLTDQVPMFATEGADYLYGTAKEDVFYGLGGDDTIYGLSGDDILAGDEGRDFIYGEAGNDTLSGGEGNDTLYGGNGDDILDGGPGNDYLYGGDSGRFEKGNDTYLFGRGYGQDTIYEDGNDTGKVDRVIMNDVTKNDVVISRDLTHLYLTIKESEDRLMVFGSFQSYKYQIEQIIFSDGNILNIQAIMDIFTTPTDESDYLVGSLSPDIIDGFAGDDQIYGQGGNDTLLGNGGNDNLNGESGDDLLYGDTGNDNLNGDYGDDLVYGQEGDDRLNGGDGNDHLDGGQGNDYLDGGVGGDILLGGEGDDKLEGNHGDDILDGGAGNDTLGGGWGVDTYLFGRGSGQDKIEEWGIREVNPSSIIRMADGLAPEEILVSRQDKYNFFLTIKDISDRLCLPIGNNWQVIFTDGRVWDTNMLLKLAATGTDGDDLLYTTETIRSLDGGLGNDKLCGGAEDDILLGGEGNDTFEGDSGADILDGGPGNDYLAGGQGDDTLDGGPGNDSLSDGPGHDTYIFGGGYGQDTINNYAGDAGQDIDLIELTAEVRPEDVTITRDYYHLYLTINHTSDRLTVSNWFPQDYNQVDQIKFADGTVWNKEEIDQKSRYLLGTEGNDRLVGYEGNDTLLGLGGDDEMWGNGGDDLLDGGQGNDLLRGAQGNDTYRFGRGYGQDRIYEEGLSSDVDRVLMTDEVKPEDIEVTCSGVSILLIIQDTGDRLELDKWLERESYRIELIIFSGGTVWDEAALIDRVSSKGTEQADVLDYQRYGFSHNIVDGLGGDDIIYGGDGFDTLVGGEGNDQLFGQEGKDTLYGGPGDDLLDCDDPDDYYGYDVLHGGPGNDLLRGGSQGDSLYGEEGDDTLEGGGGGDKLDGGTGHDLLQGGGGGDRYYFGRGYGHDIINDSDPSKGGSDGVQMAPDIAPEDILVSRDATNLYLTIKGSEDGLVLENWFVDEAAKIEVIWFGTYGINYTYWREEILREKARIITGSDQDDLLYGYEDADTISGLGGDDTLIGNIGNDIIYGEGGNDTLIGEEDNDILSGGEGNDYLNGGQGNDQLDGGLGNDSLQGGLGNDSYIFYRGSGSDKIIDVDETEGNLDTIEMASDIQPADIRVISNGTDLYLTIIDTSDTLCLSNWLVNDSFKIEQVVFADETIWDIMALGNLAYTNNRPEAADDFITTNEDKFINIATLDLLLNDRDPDVFDGVKIKGIDTSQTLGLVTDNGDGTFTYDPNGQFEYLEEGQVAYDSFQYLITDGYGGTDIATVTMSITGLAEPMTPTMNLPAGWSLISLPVRPQSLLLQNLFPGAGAVFCFDQMYQYIDQDEAMVVGQGYWICLSEPTSYTITGVPVESYTLNLPRGWSMIGGCSFAARISVITEDVRIEAIFSFDKRYKLIESDADLSPGQGYWLCLSDSAEILVEVQPEEIISRKKVLIRDIESLDLEPISDKIDHSLVKTSDNDNLTNNFKIRPSNIGAAKTSPEIINGESKATNTTEENIPSSQNLLTIADDEVINENLANTISESPVNILMVPNSNLKEKGLSPSFDHLVDDSTIYLGFQHANKYQNNQEEFSDKGHFLDDIVNQGILYSDHSTDLKHFQTFIQSLGGTRLIESSGLMTGTKDPAFNHGDDQIKVSYLALLDSTRRLKPMAVISFLAINTATNSHDSSLESSPTMRMLRTCIFTVKYGQSEVMRQKPQEVNHYPASLFLTIDPCSQPIVIRLEAESGHDRFLGYKVRTVRGRGSEARTGEPLSSLGSEIFRYRLSSLFLVTGCLLFFWTGSDDKDQGHHLIISE